MPRALAALVAALVAIAPSRLAAQKLSTADIAARAAPATVTILTFDAAGDTLGLGSGFVVKPTGVVVTNWHVVQGAARAVVRLSTGEAFDRVEALDGDESADLAILKIPGYSMATLAPQATLPPVGSRLVVIGSPLGLAQTVSEGIVSATRVENGRELLQMTVPISPGSSGGPVLNARGQVVAVATKYMARGQQLNFAVPVRYAMGLVETTRAPRPLHAMFGAAATGRLAAAGSPGAPAFRGSSRVPDPTRSPRASLAGSYRGVLHSRFTEKDGSRRTLQDTVQVYLAADDRGVVLVEQNESRLKAFALPVITSNTTPDGRVVLDLGLAPMNGYQTESGFVAAGERTRDDGEHVEVALVVERSAFPLTAATGLYRLDVRTVYKKKGAEPEPLNWTGYAAVVVLRDSAFVDLHIGNESGGSNAGWFVGRIKNGRFKGKTDGKHPNVLEIDFLPGRFAGKWTDRRENGATFEGTIEGRRE